MCFCIFVKLGWSILATGRSHAMFCECLLRGGVENIRENCRTGYVVNSPKNGFENPVVL